MGRVVNGKQMIFNQENSHDFGTGCFRLEPAFVEG